MKKQLLFKQLKKLKAFSLIALVFMATINLSAQNTNTWVGGTSTDFLDATNWTAALTASPYTPGTVTFSSNTTFLIPAGTTYNASLTTNYPGTTSNGMTVKPNASITTAGNMNLGGSSSYTYIDGLLTVTAGTFNGRGNIYIGNDSSGNNNSTITITGGTVNAKNVIYVGRNKPGTVNVNGGTFSCENQAVGGITVGGSGSIAGTININSGTVKINKAAGLSMNTNGIINIDGGSLVMAGDQTTLVAGFITANKIKLYGQALTDGKIISNTYDSSTTLTTVIAILAPNTSWDGTTWVNGTPDATKEAIIDGSYSTTTNGAFTALKLTVNTGKSLTINTGTNITIQNKVINNGTLVVENNANLIQVLGTTNTNTGAITVNRNSNPLLRLDYTLWSSPVAGQNLAAFSPLTSQSPSRFYTYDTANNLYSTIASPTTTSFANGTGYLIRMPNTADSTTPTAYAGQFTGVPNNGDISFTLSTAGSGYNLVGNPYPSPITAATLVANNSTIISPTLYFWRKTNGLGTAYCTYNTAGSIFTTNNNTQSVDPAGIIQSGQGFFVQAIAPGSLVFKNEQRSTNTTGQFFKTKQVAASSRIWLNAINATGDFSQMAVNYTEGATQGVDAFDGKYINDSPLALTSNINNDEYTIQGRPAFDASDVVPLNFKTNVAGDYTIAIDHADGLFATGQDVYLVDNTTGTETNLKTNAYTFTATTGTANSRFALKYQKTLKVDAPAFNENSVAVYKNNETLYVNSGVNNISNIKVFDIQGRLIVEQKNVNTNSSAIKNLKASQQVLIVKVTSQDNKVVNKKVVH